ncbi:hypothetical protein P152DRAFT_458429 [Eremomyces bilateralis CBS 781.70]|uniref:Biogenesis of lysosome-related organelles complex 1 subunit 1 n=1 Tax=Eremomyces bilateralis CBS 781.70 TaxID=1392243 RepID=A0A6G1G3G8_9PEZI|nr:uncharacterized protein P152DRAFT_458429 [Eremomyces bilateralis CBS 781.70]KAF1812604.1 hypothetical protein P152DRAFT_458429 [Eremomyces bilateralis CBS 781.70]
MSSPQDEERRVAEARAAVTASLAAVGSSIDNDMKTRAADLHANAASIEKQEKQVAKATAALTKETAKLQKMADTSTKKLKEMGDLQTWAETIERDMLVIEETMRLVEGKEDANNASGTNITSS